MKIYITHCSAKKNPLFAISSRETTPDVLYSARPTQRFMAKCKAEGVEWAIFSDLYGIWFPDIKHAWYEKNPKTVTTNEYDLLLADFNTKLSLYDEILFTPIPADSIGYTNDCWKTLNYLKE